MAIYVNNLPRKQKHALFAGFQFVETLREMRPHMPMQMASVYLLVAMKPGISQRELFDLMGISQASISRNVTALSDRDRHGKPGLNLIIQKRNPVDCRNTAIYLTTEGEALLSRLLSVSSLRS